MSSSQGGGAPGWSINKAIPVAYIGAIFFQTVVFLVVGTAWVTQTNLRLGRLEEFMVSSVAIHARLAVIDSRLATLDRIDNDLRQLILRNQIPRQ